jgi:hypothetical protein
MRVKIQVVIESDDGHVQDVEEVACLKRGALTPEELGLNLAEAKQILHNVQDSMLGLQVAEYQAKRKNCPRCARPQPQKGRHEIVFRTLFGKFNLPSVRLYRCDCEEPSERTFSPLAELLTERTAPELLYLEAKWCTLLSFGVSVDLLREVLPLGEELNTVTLRNNLHKVAGRIEAELGEERVSFLDVSQQSPPVDSIPAAKPPLMLGLDGAYVHAGGRAGWFEVIVAKSVTAAGEGKYAAFVHNYDRKPKRRLYEVLKSQGLESDQPVRFLSDGGDTVRKLQMWLSPQSEHLLDWFHVTMRLTVMGQLRKGLNGVEPARLVEQTEQNLESIKWHLWNGNVDQALELVGGLRVLLADDHAGAERQKLLKAVREFGAYIANNQGFIPDYGDRYRNRETITTAFVESAVNCLVSKRMIKQQQMHWTERGAHLLLQVRAQVLNDELRPTFCRWYPAMKPDPVTALPMAA